MQKGIDLSKWNGGIDFGKVKESGIEFVLLREGYGRKRDPKFLEYVHGCQNRDLPILGVYHFSYALTRYEAENEAEIAVKNVKEAGLPDDTIIFFDYEYDSVRYAKGYGYNPDKKTCTDFTKAFCDKVEVAGYRPGVYYNVDFENNWYEKWLLAKYVRWVADWRDGQTHPEAAIHQYSSKGIVPGIGGEVDMNYFRPELVKMEVANLSPMTTAEKIALEVLDGKWGNGMTRRIRLMAAGYNYNEVQAAVNAFLKNGV